MLVILTLDREFKVNNPPEPGVIATSPATTPEQNPTVDHFLSSR